MQVSSRTNHLSVSINHCHFPHHFRDTAQDRLVQEVQDIQGTVEQLHHKLQQAEATHQALLKTRCILEEDLRNKVNALFIDREKCMSLRRSFPISNLIRY